MVCIVQHEPTYLTYKKGISLIFNIDFTLEETKVRMIRAIVYTKVMDFWGRYLTVILAVLLLIVTGLWLSERKGAAAVATPVPDPVVELFHRAHDATARSIRGETLVCSREKLAEVCFVFGIRDCVIRRKVAGVKPEWLRARLVEERNPPLVRGTYQSVCVRQIYVTLD